MFTKSAEIYDAIYSFKEYRRESEQVHAEIQKYKKSDGNTLLDIACGTGKHLSFLSAHYDVEGLDLDPELLKIAQKTNPGVKLHLANMLDFRTDTKYDAIVSLFSAVGYLKNENELKRTLINMSHHLKHGGVLVVEPWLTPDVFHTGSIHANFVNDPELKIARMCLSEKHGDKAILKFHYLVGTPHGVTSFDEVHDTTLFTHKQYMTAFNEAGLRTEHDPEGIFGRGLYVGMKESEKLTTLL